MAKFKRICEKYGESQLFQRALTHSSFVHEKSNCQFSYERLEFLGDSILGMICAETLISRCPELDEGQLSRLRSYFVSEASLSMRARRLDLGTHIYLGRGEAASGGRERDSILADVVEALVAAIYLDKGLSETREFLNKEIFQEWEMEDQEWIGLIRKLLKKDAKSSLQELFQRNHWGLPKYVCLNSDTASSQGPFEMAVFVNEVEIARTMSESKKEGSLELATSLLAMGLPKLVALLSKLGLNTKTLNHDLGLNSENTVQ